MFFSASALANSGSSQTRMLSKMDPALTWVHTPSDKVYAEYSVQCVRSRGRAALASPPTQEITVTHARASTK